MPVSRPVRGSGCVGHLGTGEGDVPAIRLSADGDGLGRALQWARPTHRNAPDLRQDQEAVVQPRAAVLTHLGIGEAVVAVAALEARIPRRFTRRHPPEERLERLVQPMQHVLQDLGVEVPVLGTHLLDARQLCRLQGKGDRDATFLARLALRSSRPAL